MRKRSIFVAAGMAAATIIGAMSPATPASAGQGVGVDVYVDVVHPDPGAVLSGLTLELWDLSDPGNPTLLTGDPDGPCGPAPTLDDYVYGVYGYGFGECSLDDYGTYAIGLDGVPDGTTVSGSCNESILNELLGSDDFTFTYEPGVFDIDCDIDLTQPVLLVDKVVDSGTAEPGDFTIEVYDDEGALADSGSDTSAGVCAEYDNLDDCLVIPLTAGTYQLGESGPEGYVASNVGCRNADVGVLVLEAFPTGIGEFTITDDQLDEEIGPVAVCEITNDYYEGDLVVTKSVTNDDGGLLGPDDFTAEVWSVTNTTIVASGDCDANGDCIAVTLPIGDYQIGEADSQGYTPSVSCTVTRDPDGPGDITTNPPTTTIQRSEEMIPGDDAMVTVEPFGEVTCEIVNDDPTTTTMAPTTTDQDGGANVPTTVTPILPPTGDDNGTMAIIATLLIALGGSLLLARRRTA